jgi:transcriptional regulator GlxA family with amidase domain
MDSSLIVDGNLMTVAGITSGIDFILLKSGEKHW